VERQAKFNVTGGRPLYRKTGDLASSIFSRVTRKAKTTIGQIGTRLFYGAVHETGKPRFIHTKRASHLRFQAGTRGMSPAKGKKSGRWRAVQTVRVKKRPWLSKAVREKRKYIRKRFAIMTQEVLKAVR
jgi:phage gpG-like protein